MRRLNVYRIASERGVGQGRRGDRSSGFFLPTVNSIYGLQGPARGNQTRAVQSRFERPSRWLRLPVRIASFRDKRIIFAREKRVTNLRKNKAVCPKLFSVSNRPPILRASTFGVKLFVPTTIL